MMRRIVYGLPLIALLAVWIAGVKASPTVDETLPSSYVPSGKLMYQQYCATCHGPDAKGTGPMASFLKTRPSDLTLLSKRHGGKFPKEYVQSVLEFGPGPPSHGSSDMPAWGPVPFHSETLCDHTVDRPAVVYMLTSWWRSWPKVSEGSDTN